MKQLLIFVFAATLLGCGPREELSQVPLSGGNKSSSPDTQPSHRLDLTMFLGRWAMAVVDQSADIVYFDDPKAFGAIVIDLIEDKSVIDTLPLTPEIRRRMEMSRQCLIGRKETKRLEYREPIIAQRFILMSDDLGRVTMILYGNEPIRSSSWRMSVEVLIVPVEGIDNQIVAYISIHHGIPDPKVFFNKRL